MLLAPIKPILDWFCVLDIKIKTFNRQIFRKIKTFVKFAIAIVIYITD